MVTRRNRLKIMADVCEAAREEILKTQLMYKANLNIDQVQEYINFLLGIRLLRKSKSAGRTVYKTTNKGVRYLENFDKIRDLMNRDVGQRKKYVVQPSMERIRSNIKSLKQELRELERNLDLVDTCPHCGKKISKAE